MKNCLCKSQIFFIMILFIVACIIYPSIIWAAETETTTPLQQISEIIDSYPDISSFQASQLLEEAEKAIQSGNFYPLSCLYIKLHSYYRNHH